MKTMKSWCGWVGVLLCLSACDVYAKATLLPAEDGERNPLGCRDVGYQFKLNAVEIQPTQEDDKQSLYFVLNRGRQPVHLYQMLQENSTRSTYMNHTISSKQWAVLATNEPHVTYSCSLDRNGDLYGKIVPCADYLKICEYTRVRFGLNNRGNFWVVNSNSRGGAVGDVVRYGIIPQ